MKELILILFPFIPLLAYLLVCCIKEFVEVMNDSDSDHTYITFDRFIAFYNINPDRWDLHYDYVRYRKTRSYFVDTVTFHFTFLECYKYKRWRKHLERLETKDRKQRLKKARLEEYQEVLECVKKDLEEFTRKNDEMMKRETEKYAQKVDEVPRMFDDGRKAASMTIDDYPELKLALKMQEIMNKRK